MAARALRVACQPAGLVSPGNLDRNVARSFSSSGCVRLSSRIVSRALAGSPPIGPRSFRARLREPSKMGRSLAPPPHVPRVSMHRAFLGPWDPSRSERETERSDVGARFRQPLQGSRRSSIDRLGRRRLRQRDVFFATLECELIDRHRLRSHSEVRMAVFQFIEGFYNPSVAIRPSASPSYRGRPVASTRGFRDRAHRLWRTQPHLGRERPSAVSPRTPSAMLRSRSVKSAPGRLQTLTR
jgi:hypothetical protein